MIGSAAGTPWTWSAEPLQLGPLLLAAGLYAGRARALARRGRPVPAARQASFFVGVGLLVVAFVSPVDSIGEERLFSAHMVQHLLIGDLAPLALVAGLSGPLLRPVLAIRFVRPLRALAHPLVAFPLWAADLVAWHVPALYDAALAHAAVHALEHGLFLTMGALVWAAILEPLPGPAWFGTARKAAYLAGTWIVTGILAQVFIWLGHAFYAPYVSAPRLWGLSAVADQRVGGGIMLLEGTAVAIGAFAWLFLRWLRESAFSQELVEQGREPAAAARAVRYGRSVK